MLRTYYNNMVSIQRILMILKVSILNSMEKVNFIHYAKN